MVRGEPSCSGCAPRSPACPASRCICSRCRTCTIETRPSPTQYQYVLQDLDPLELRTWTQRLLDALRHDPSFADVAERSAGRGPADGDPCRSCSGGALRRHDERDRQHAVRCVRPAADRDGVFAADAVSRGAGGDRLRSAPMPSMLEQDLRHRRERARSEHGRCGERRRRRLPCGLRADSTVHLRARRAATGAARHHASRIVSSQPPSRSTCRPAWRWARRWTHCIVPNGAIGLPDSITTNLAGSAAEFAASLSSEKTADPGGDRHGLYRAGRALRELHPSDHHPVDVAFGGRGRAARADAVRREPRSDLADRHHPADRHREEERHHDGGLRAGRRTQRGPSRPRNRSVRRAGCAIGRS